MDHVLARGRLVAIAGFVVIAAAIAGCGGGGSSAPQVGMPASQGGQAPAAQASDAGFTATQSQTLTGSGSPVPLPTGSGYGGTVTLPTPQATIPAHTVMTETLTTSASGASRLPQFVAPPSNLYVVLYLQLQFSNAMTIPLPSFLINAPAGVINSNDSYYLAMYDPQASQGFPSGWQFVEGPANVGCCKGSSAQLYFSGPSYYPYNTYAYPFAAYSPVYFAVVAGGATPPPSPSPAPSGTPAPPFYLSPSSIQVPGIGAQATTYFYDYSGCQCSYNATVTNANVATAYLDGNSLYVTGVSAGLTSVVISASDGRRAIGSIVVTQTNVNVQGAHRR